MRYAKTFRFILVMQRARKAHAIVHRDVFDNSFSFYVICQMSSDKILKKETIWPHRLRTADPL